MTRREFVALGLVAGAGAAGVTAFSRRASDPIAFGRLQERFVSAGGVLSVELTASEQWVDLAGRQARLYAFNGRVPGPVLEARPGDDVQVRLRNTLREPTNLHFHGLHLSPNGTADNIFVEIPEGEEFNYGFRLPPNHPPGFFWIHPHVHGLVAHQVSLGLAMPFIVRGGLDSIPEVAASREHFLILQDFELDGAGRPVNPGMSASMMGREGSLVTVSGQRQQQYVIEQDGLMRLRFLNASASRFYRLRLDDHPLHIIATDGGAIAAPQTVDELVLAPGERRDVLVQGRAVTGSYRLMNLPYDRGSAGMMGGGTSATEIELARFVYQGRAERRRTIPQTLVQVPALPPATVRRTFELSDAMGMIPGRGMGMRFRINGREFDANRIDTSVRLGSVEEWEFVNTTTMDHPMHIHTNSFQVVGADGQPERAWRDVVVVKARSRARVRIAFADFAGKSVQHCHILDHEDLGMMGTILIEP